MCVCVCVCVCIIYIKLNHFATHQKHCKSTILQQEFVFRCTVWHEWDSSSPTQHGTHAVTAQSPNH